MNQSANTDSSPENPSESRFECAQNGDENAFDEILADLLTRLYPVALRKMGVAQAMGRTATDRVASVLASVVARPSLILNCNSEEHAFAFLLNRINWKFTADHKEKKREKNSVVEKWVQEYDSLREGEEFEFGPEQTMQLLKAVEELTAEDKKLIELVSKGLPFTQIGKKLGISDNGARKRFRKVGRKIREKLSRKSETSG